MQVEEVLAKLGSPGRYQMLVYFCLWLCNATSSINHTIMAVIGYSPPFRCNSHANKANSNTSSTRLFNKAPHRELDVSKCLGYVILNGTQTDDEAICTDGWHFYQFQDEATIVSEWSLVCDKLYLVNLASTLYFGGVLLGGIVFGQLADTYGRKNVLLFSLYSYVIISISVYFTDSVISFVGLRMVIGFLIQGVQMSSYVLLTELTVLKFRSMMAGIFDLFWAVGLIWLATLSWLIPKWKDLQLALTLPTLITIFYIVILPESIRWLANEKRYAKAEETVRKISRYNKVDLPDDLELYLEHPNVKDKRRKKYTFWNLVRTPNIRRKTIIFGFAWFSSSFGYYGLLLGSTEFPGDRHRNFFISSFAELAAMFSAFCALKFLPRRYPLAFCYLCGGLACLISGVARNSENQHLANASTPLAIAGRVFMTASFPIVSLFCIESFPTVLRSIGLGSCIVWARVGGMVAPQILLLGNFTVTELPFVIFGSVSIVASISVLSLKETRRSKLPETIEEVEQRQVIHNNFKPGTTLKYTV